MKNILFVILIAAFVAGCAGKSNTTDNAAQANATVVANKTVTLAIEGMTCSGCENTISEAVTKIAGVSTVKASHLDSTAIVSFDSTLTTISVIGTAITDAGYDFKGEKIVSVPVETK
jgi:copper chaperone CopZ